MSWKYFEGIFARRVENVLKISWRHLEEILMKNALKSSWRVFWRSISKANIFVLNKMSWRSRLKMNTRDVFETSSRHFYKRKWLLAVLCIKSKRIISDLVANNTLSRSFTHSSDPSCFFFCNTAFPDLLLQIFSNDERNKCMV